MEDNCFNLKTILGILFKITKKNANILADRYLLKEVSIISKWKNNKTEIKSEDIYRIVDFAVKETSKVQRKMIRKEILTVIDCSSVTEEIKQMLTEIKDFGEFIEESLNVCTSWSYDVPDADISNGLTGKLGSEDEYSLELDKGLEGGYKGIVKFDLELIKNNHESTSNKKNSLLKNSEINVIPRNKLGNAKKFIEARSVLTVILIVAILSYTFIQASNNNKKVASDINPTQASQSANQSKKSVEAVQGEVAAKKDKTVPTKKSDENKTNPSRENENNNQKKSPASVDKSQNKTINRPKTNNNIKTQTEQKNNDININISGSSDLNIGVGNNIIINNNKTNEASDTSRSKGEAAASSAQSTDKSKK